jgi:GNAT superfamily N-acetyltransferase
MEKIRRLKSSESINDIIKISEFSKSTFDHFIPLFVRQALASSGEVFVSEEGGSLRGLYIYDPIEETGTCFTNSTSTAKNFYSLGLGAEFFSEIKFKEGAKIEKINYLNISCYESSLSIRNHIEILDFSRLSDIKRFLKKAYHKVNEKWVATAMETGEKCFCCEVDNHIIGMGWISPFMNVARLHSLYVEPEYRHISIGKDLLISRLYYAAHSGINKVISEIPEQSIYSQRIATEQGFRIDGILYSYQRTDSLNNRD